LVHLVVFYDHFFPTQKTLKKLSEIRKKINLELFLIIILNAVGKGLKMFMSLSDNIITSFLREPPH